jgi:hypothetical protein
LTVAEETIKILKIRDIAANGRDASRRSPSQRRPVRLAPPGDKHVGALGDEAFCGRQPMPLLPPVTTAIFPSSLPIAGSFSA